MWLLRNPGPQPKEVAPVMPDTFARAHDHHPASDRRAHARQLIPSLAYVELDEGNGGIILNISEGGLSVQAVTSLMDDVLPGVRFQLADTVGWVEAQARISWTNDTRKLAGLEFINLSEDCRGRLRQWLDRDAVSTAGSEATETRDPGESTTQEADALPRTVPLDDSRDALPAGPPRAAEPPAELSASSAVTADIAPPADAEPDVEAASAVLAELMASVSDHVHHPAPYPPPPASSLPPPPIPFRQIAEAKAGEAKDAVGYPADDEDIASNRWSAILLLAALAIGSLAAGWAAGQGHLGKLLARLHGGASQGANEIRGAFERLGLPATHLSEIEVENINGQRWSIPFNGPLNSTNAVHRPTAAYGAEPAQKPQPGFRTWILTPPQQQTRPATDDGSAIKEAPPVVPEAFAPSDGILNSASGARSLAPPPVLPVPSPATPTGIVKQGLLIHRVDPIYPEAAKSQHAEGTIRLNVTVGPDGIVRGVALLGGPRLLVNAAEGAVRQWRYTPTLLDGKPVEFQREVDLTFRLSNPLP
jgi:TonB family protein